MPEQSSDHATLIKAVRTSVGIFLDHDLYLLELYAHEQAIAHRIAFYLEWQFDVAERLNFDCEYNKHLKGNKTIEIDLNDLRHHEFECRACPCAVCQKFAAGGDIGELDDRLFRPDIVVHSRGNDARNLVVIEIKKNHFCPFDAAKLKALTRAKEDGGRYGYQLGVFMSLSDRKPSFRWYQSRDVRTPQGR